MNRKIEITFECNQDWEQMKISGEGRHCELCAKAVHDFSGKTNDEIVRLGKGDLCGMFLTEQINSDLRPVEFPSRWRTTLLTIATALGLELSQAHGQPLVKFDKIENVTSDTTKADTSIVAKQRMQIGSAKSDLSHCDKVKRPLRTRYYFSKRFPFVVKRRIRVIGRFRM